MDTTRAPSADAEGINRRLDGEAEHVEKAVCLVVRERPKRRSKVYRAKFGGAAVPSGAVGSGQGG